MPLDWGENWVLFYHLILISWFFCCFFVPDPMMTVMMMTTTTTMSTATTHNNSSNDSWQCQFYRSFLCYWNNHLIVLPVLPTKNFSCWLTPNGKTTTMTTTTNTAALCDVFILGSFVFPFHGIFALHLRLGTITNLSCYTWLWYMWSNNRHNNKNLFQNQKQKNPFMGFRGYRRSHCKDKKNKDRELLYWKSAQTIGYWLIL